MDASTEKLGFIDSARGIAILLVILVHTAQAVDQIPSPVGALAKYGQMGVQLFFVVSAYTLCLTYTRRTGESKPYLSFLIRRIFRIAPLYYVGIILYFGISVIRSYYVPAHVKTDPYSFGNVLSNVLFIHGFVPSAANSIVPGGWSIGTEMAFYVCFPLVFFVFNRLRDKGMAAMLMLVVIAVLLNLLYHNMLAHRFGLQIHNNNFLYFNLINQFPVFLLGITLFFVHQLDHQNSCLPASRLLQLSGFVLSTACALLLWKFEIDLSFAVIPTVSGVSFWFLLNLLRSGFLDLKVLQRIGRVSYSMYIFHFVSVWYFLEAIKPIVLAPYWPPVIFLLFSFLAVCGVTYLVAVVSERIIESKGIALGRRALELLRARIA